MSVTTVIEKEAPRAPLAPIDPRVALPPSVLAAVKRAEEAHKAAYSPDAATTVVQADPAAPVQQAPDPAATPQAAPAPAPVNTPAAPSVDTLAQYDQNPTAPAPAPAPDDQSAEHKFKSMQGRFNAQSQQMRQMQAQMTEMGNELIAARQMIDSLRQPPQRQQQPTPQSLITEQDRSAFGDDFLDAAARAGAERVLPEVAAARQEVAQTRQELHQIRLGRVYDALHERVGENWRNVNRHPRFNAWLALRDPISGVIRKSLLDGAMQAADAARVVNIFQGFLAEDAANRPAAPAPQPSSAPATAAGQRQPVVSLDALAAPGRASAAPGSPPAAQKPTYTHADFTKFAEDVRRGKYAGRDAEKMAVEQDMHASQFDGRLRRY